MIQHTRDWITIMVTVIGAWGGSMASAIWFSRRHRRRMSDRIYYHRTLAAGNKRTMTLYPEKLTEAERDELARMEARLLELAETAEEEMAMNLKEGK